MSARRTLFVSSFAPVLGSGRALRTYTCVRALATFGPVDLAYVTHESDDPSPEYEAIENVAFHRIRSSRGLRRAAVYIGKRAQGIPSSSCRGTSPELIETAERLANAPERGRVIVGDMGAASALLRLAASRPVIYNGHNIESEYLRGAPGHRLVRRIAMRRFESRLLRLSDESWMVSRGDIRSAQELVPRARLRYMPNVVDVAAITPPPRRGKSGEAGSRLVMVGDFTYEPNLTGLEFFVREALPRVWASLPNATLTLVGRGLEAWTAPDARVTVAGFRDELAGAYAEADCVVVPLTEGAGTPLKFVEALAYGMPVVATPLAAKGLEVTAGVHYYEAHDGPLFAGAIVRVLREGGVEMGAAARRLAEREYSIETLVDCLQASLALPQPQVAAVSGREQDHLAPDGLARPLAPVRWLARAAGAGLGRRYPFVLCYHGVGDIGGAADPGGVFLDRALFERHLELIAERGYELETVSGLWAKISHGARGADGLGSISFDDGLAKTAREAIPMLLERGHRCSMFIPTGLLGRPHPDVGGELIMRPEEVRELAEQGVEIGAHSVDHVHLTRLGYDAALEQMRRSRATLEDLLGKSVRAMAYPFGAFDARTMRAAEEAGFEIACACAGPGPWRALCLPRQPMYATASDVRLRLKIAGLYGPAHVVRRAQAAALARKIAPARRGSAKELLAVSAKARR